MVGLREVGHGRRGEVARGKVGAIAGPDERKEGGAYLTVTGVVRKLDPAARRIIMQDGTVIPAAEISAMEGEIFSDMDEW